MVIPLRNLTLHMGHSVGTLGSTIAWVGDGDIAGGDNGVPDVCRFLSDEHFEIGEPDLKFPWFSDRARAHSGGWSPGGAAFAATSSVALADVCFGFSVAQICCGASSIIHCFSSSVSRICCSASWIMHCFGLSKLQPSPKL